MPRQRDGRAIKYETPAGMPMAFDIHPAVRHLAGDPRVPLVITEGVKEGDALASRGLCVVALLGVWCWRGTNEVGGKTALAAWDEIAVNGRYVYFVFDSDVMVKPTVHAALGRLGAFLEHRGAQVQYVYLPAGADDDKVGVDDYLAGGHTVDDLFSLASPTLQTATDDAGDRPAARDTADGGSRSQASVLLALAEDVDLFRDELGDTYAAIVVNGHRETRAVRSNAFRQWLAQHFYASERKVPNATSLTDAIQVLEGRAQFEGDVRPVRLRVAEDADGCLYLDLGTPAWDAVRIGPQGWDIVATPPVHFRRSSATEAMPRPVGAGR